MLKAFGLWRRASSRPLYRLQHYNLGVFFAAGLLCASSCAASAAPLVATKEGIVKGFIKDGVAEFLGIPYAEPPIGSLRWKPPVKRQPWAGRAESDGLPIELPAE